MNKFAQVAERETTLSTLMNGREKMTMDEVIGEWPNGVTIVGFDIVEMYSKKTKTNQAVPVLIFAEDGTKFFMGGTVLAKICVKWAELFEGDVEAASAELARAGGVKMAFEAGKTNEGNDITKVHVLG